MSSYSILPLISALVFISLGLFVYLKNRHSAVNALFALSCLATFGWQFTWAILFSIEHEALAPWLVKVGYTSITLIPTLAYHFAILHIGANGEVMERRIIRLSYLFCSAMLLMLWFTSLFIRGYKPHVWGNYPVAGPLHPLYLTHLTFLAVRVLYRLWKDAGDLSLPALMRMQRKYLFWAFSIYCLASMDFLVNYGADFYPFGFVFVLASLGILFYTIVQYRLMDIRVAIVRGATFLFVYVPLLFLPIIGGVILRTALERWLGFNWWILPALLAAVLAVGGLWVYRWMTQRAEERLLADQRRYQQLLVAAAEGGAQGRGQPKPAVMTRNDMDRKAKTALKRNLALIGCLFRDLLLRYMPSFLAQAIAGHGTYAFIVHPRDLDDHARKYPFAKEMPKIVRYLWSRFQWPIIGSQITGLVTRYGRRENGWMIICPLTTQQMIKNRKLASKRVLQSVQLAEKLGARIVGLGAFTSIVTSDGKDLLGKVRCGLTTGNAYSAAVAVDNVCNLLQAISKPVEKSVVAVVGAAGSEGSACSKLLAGKVAKLILIDKNVAGGENLAKQLMQHGQAETKFTTRIDAIREADAVIAVTNAPGAIVRASHLKPGAIVVDAAQPKNVSHHIPKQRKDVLVVESAIVQTPGVRINFDLGLGETEALGCLAETQVLTWLEHRGHFSLGKADLKQVQEIYEAAREAGYRLAPFRNSIGYISEEDIARVRWAAIERDLTDEHVRTP